MQDPPLPELPDDIAELSPDDWTRSVIATGQGTIQTNNQPTNWLTNQYSDVPHNTPLLAYVLLVEWLII